MNISVQTMLSAALVIINIVLVMVGLKVKADVSDMKVFMFEKFVSKDLLESRLSQLRDNERSHTRHYAER